jgi:hypothetical protein
MRLFLYGALFDALTRVVVRTANGKTVAHTWIAPGGMRREWRK